MKGKYEESKECIRLKNTKNTSRYSTFAQHQYTKKQKTNKKINNHLALVAGAVHYIVTVTVHTKQKCV